MKELQRKQRFKHLLYSLPSLFLLALTAFFLVKGAVSMMNKERESASKVTELEGEVVALTLREGELKKEISRLGTQEGIFEEIKSKFSVTREGEYVAIIVDEKLKESSSSTSTAEWFRDFWQRLKGL